MADNRTLGEKLQSLPRQAIYAILFAVTTIPLFFTFRVPIVPDASTVDMYAQIHALAPGSVVFVESDWTNSTRGESSGQFQALIRLLMQREIKFVLYSMADPQAPRVAMDEIARINAERVAAGQRPYERWNDWVNAGFFPNAEATAAAMATNYRAIFGAKSDTPPGGQPTSVLRSPVLQNIENISDADMLFVVTASKTSTVVIERIFGRGVPLAFFVTGVMGPETLVYYQSGQLVAVVAGLRGVYEMETLMASGVNTDIPGSYVTDRHGVIPAFSVAGYEYIGKGTAYYPTLHFALTLLILMVVIGNIGMFMVKRAKA
jgi:hypothetical protein